MKYRMAKVLIIDDEMQLRRLLSRIIGLEGYEVAEAADCASGMKMLRQHEPDVVLCDVKLPDGSGVELVSRIKEAAPAVEVILMTAYGNIPDGVQAIKNGAFDYITKGDDNNKILPLLSRASEKAQMQRRLARFEDKLSEENSFDRVIGSSAALREAVELARKVAVTDTSVLLTGETGTGKEVFARAIHHASRRAHEAFVADSGLTFEYRAEKGVLVVGDPDMIRQATANLISNAVRYTPEGGHVSVTVSKGDIMASIAVRDTGIGLSPEEAKMVFSRFWRADAGRNRASGGLGIGLAVVKEIVDRHGGWVQVEGEKGKGACFTLHFPLYDEQRTRTNDKREQQRQRQQQKQQHRQQLLSGARQQRSAEGKSASNRKK